MVLSNNFLWWCKECGVPLLKSECENCGHKGVKICSDLKPMFYEECRFLKKGTGKKFPGESWQEKLWMRHKTIWFNGRRLFRLSANGKPTIIKEYPHRDNLTKYVTQKTLYKANKTRIDELEKKAISFIKEIIKSYPERKPVVSFSGGKDSTVVSYLIRKALGVNKVFHIFGNTTIEYPDTYSYIDRFFRNNKKIPLCENSSNHTFFEMCKLIGPPSRTNAWCCSVFKAAPIATIVNRVNGKHGVISFEGIRKKESARRRNRQDTYFNKKIVHQLSAYPILEWREIDVWFYLLIKGLDFNDAYRKGFSRVGCLYVSDNKKEYESNKVVSP
ncbi:MAG: phosphoadenosine phosphosulfate reductase family protein [Nitrospirota bacterium]